MTAVITGNNEIINSAGYYFQQINTINIFAVRKGKLRKGGPVVG